MQKPKNSDDSSIAEKLIKLINKDAQIGVIKKEICSKQIYIFYVESLIDKKLFSSMVIDGLDLLLSQKEKTTLNIDEIKKVVNAPSAEIFTVIKQLVDKLLSGNVIVCCDDKALVIPLVSFEKRSVQEPPTSRVIKGPREGFVEDIFTNINLVRHRLKTLDLRLKDFVVGRKTKTQVTIIYLDKIASKEVVKNIEKRLNQIDIDGIIDSYYIESFLENKKLSFFKRIGNTEKPDVLVAKILEGRVGILVDGSPIALTAPFILLEDLQSSQDYYNIPSMATFGRIMRIFGLIFAILAPGIFVALQSYNYRILPINFLITILSSIEGLSVPPLIEILVVLLLFEIITEASLQMPNSLGMALSIIGALALGNTAVDAGIISPPSIVIVATSSVALYIIPDQIAETRILRLLFTTLGGIIGLYGIILAFLILTTYMTSIKSFGVAYFEPVAPYVKEDTKDMFIKSNLRDMKTRPKLIAEKNRVRLDDDQLEESNEVLKTQIKKGGKNDS